MNRALYLTFLVLFIALFGCGKFEGPKGPKGEQGLRGPRGFNGSDAVVETITPCPHIERKYPEKLTRILQEINKRNLN